MKDKTTSDSTLSLWSLFCVQNLYTYRLGVFDSSPTSSLLSHYITTQHSFNKKQRNRITWKRIIINVGKCRNTSGMHLWRDINFSKLRLKSLKRRNKIISYFEFVHFTWRCVKLNDHYQWTIFWTIMINHHALSWFWVWFWQIMIISSDFNDMIFEFFYVKLFMINQRALMKMINDEFFSNHVLSW